MDLAGSEKVSKTGASGVTTTTTKITMTIIIVIIIIIIVIVIVIGSFRRGEKY